MGEIRMIILSFMAVLPVYFSDLTPGFLGHTCNCTGFGPGTGCPSGKSCNQSLVIEINCTLTAQGRYSTGLFIRYGLASWVGVSNFSCINEKYYSNGVPFTFNPIAATVTKRPSCESCAEPIFSSYCPADSFCVPSLEKYVRGTDDCDGVRCASGTLYGKYANGTWAPAADPFCAGLINVWKARNGTTLTGEFTCAFSKYCKQCKMLPALDNPSIVPAAVLANYEIDLTRMKTSGNAPGDNHCLVQYCEDGYDFFGFLFRFGVYNSTVAFAPDGATCAESSGGFWLSNNGGSTFPDNVAYVTCIRSKRCSQCGAPPILADGNCPANYSCNSSALHKSKNLANCTEYTCGQDSQLIIGSGATWDKTQSSIVCAVGGKWQTAGGQDITGKSVTCATSGTCKDCLAGIPVTSAPGFCPDGNWCDSLQILYATSTCKFAYCLWGILYAVHPVGQLEMSDSIKCAAGGVWRTYNNSEISLVTCARKKNARECPWYNFFVEAGSFRCPEGYSCDHTLIQNKTIYQPRIYACDTKLKPGAKIGVLRHLANNIYSVITSRIVCGTDKKWYDDDGNPFDQGVGLTCVYQ